MQMALTVQKIELVVLKSKITQQDFNIIGD